MLKNQLEIDGVLVEIIRKPIKNMHLRIYPPEAQVKLSAPLRLKLELIRHFLETKRDWIHAQRTRLLSQVSQLSVIFAQGEKFYFLGKPYTLLIHYQQKPASCRIEGDNLHCFIRAEAADVEKERLLQNWYRQEMKKRLPPLIQKWSAVIGVSVNDWGIKQMKTRWGSCNMRDKRIWLNLHLIKKPLACLEYVLVHELIHLLEPHHNKRFYSLMDQFMPGWKNHQIELEGRLV